MVANSGKIKKFLETRLYQDQIVSKVNQDLWDFYIQNACMEIASTNYWRDLLKTVNGSCSNTGEFTIEDNVVPYQYYYAGVEDQNHTWIRATPIDYDYFLRYTFGYALTRMYPAGFIVNRGYTIIPSENHNHTVLKFTNLNAIYSVKLTYYPITPDPDDFPDYFIPWIVNRTMELISVDQKSEMKDRTIQQLKQETDLIKKAISSRANKIEKNLSKTIRNNKQRRYLLSEPFDIFFWRTN